MCQEGIGGRRLVGQDTPSQSIRVYLALLKPVPRASRPQSAPPKPAKKAARHSCHTRAVSIPGLRGVKTQPREVTRSVQGRKGSKGYYPGEKHSSPAQSLERKVKSGPSVMLPRASGEPVPPVTAAWTRGRVGNGTGTATLGDT